MLTVPNAITVVRLACLPLFVVLVVARHPSLRYQAALLLGALGATDWIDGFLARRLGQVSSLGKVLDPVADRLLLLTAIATMVAIGAVPAWVAGLALARESVVAAATLALAALGAARIDVTWWGKAGTFGLMVAFPLFLTSHSTAGWHVLAGTLAWVAAVPALVLAYIALARYIPLARRALAEGRTGRVGAISTVASAGALRP
jgi:cardiolipin synthase